MRVRDLRPEEMNPDQRRVAEAAGQLIAPRRCWPDDGWRQLVEERAERPQPSTTGNLATATGQGGRASGSGAERGTVQRE